MNDTVLLGIAGIVIIGVLTQWLSVRLRIPSILLLLAAGILAGPVFGWLDPDELFGELLEPFVSLAVGVILFEGGLSLRLRELEGVANVTWRLVSIGAVATWFVVGAAAALLFDMPAAIAALLGAILVVSGPTVVIPLLREVRPTRPLGAILKWEGIVIDAVGAMLAVIVFEAILQGQVTRPLAETIREIVIFLLVGVGVGAAVAAIMVPLLRRFQIPDFLHSGVSLMMALTAFTAANSIQSEAGLLATIVLGFAVANQRSVSVRSIVEFSETLRVLLIAVLFIVLAARLEIDAMLALGGAGLVFLLIVIVVARPLATWLSTVGSKLNWRERLFLSGVAPRGIVAASISAVFASELAEADFEGAETIVPAAFLVIIGTVAVYGFAAAPLAKWLGVAQPPAHGVVVVGAGYVAREIALGLAEAQIPVTVVATNRSDDYTARMAGLDTTYTTLLGEHIDEPLLEGVAMALALTPNDEYNSLVSLRLADHLGQGATFQLAPSRESESSGTQRPPELRGRLLFDEELDHQRLATLLHDGYVLKATQLSDEFDFDAYLGNSVGDVYPLFVVDGSGGLRASTIQETETKPQPGEKVIGLAREKNSDPGP
ncbi:MAG: sodium:proton antiporter [Actinobacteria bacterium]|nr:MAG: sodium:proton antiporter [Actinomycetota bacterium]